MPLSQHTYFRWTYLELGKVGAVVPFLSGKSKFKLFVILVLVCSFGKIEMRDKTQFYWLLFSSLAVGRECVGWGGLMLHASGVCAEMVRLWRGRGHRVLIHAGQYVCCHSRMLVLRRQNHDKALTDQRAKSVWHLSVQTNSFQSFPFNSGRFETPHISFETSKSFSVHTVQKQTFTF